jgi:hypothetical protein
MISFTIYSTTTGAIIRAGIVRTQDIALQVQSGESILTGVQGNAALQKVDVTQPQPVLVAIQ